MGLAERRAAKEFQDKRFVELRDELHKAAGFEVPLEVNWDQLSVEGMTALFKDAWTEIFFRPAIEGLRKITRDEMGKAALAAALKKVVFRNSCGASSPTSAISFVGGALVIDHELSNLGDTQPRIRHLVELVEKAL